MRSMVPGLKFSATTSKFGHEREEQLAALGRLQVDADAALVEVVAQVGGADVAALGVDHRRASTPVPTRRAPGARPSPRRRRGGRAAAWRTAAPASARRRARARRRAACRTAPHPRSRRRPAASRHTRGEVGDGRSRLPRHAPETDVPRADRTGADTCVIDSPHARHHQRRRLRAVPAPATGRDRQDVRQRRGQGHPFRRRRTTRTPRRMGVEAARLALRSAPAGTAPSALWFSTASPAYLDKNNASTLHAALATRHRRRRVRLRRRAALGSRRVAHGAASRAAPRCS